MLLFKKSELPKEYPSHWKNPTQIVRDLQGGIVWKNTGDGVTYQAFKIIFVLRKADPLPQTNGTLPRKPIRETWLSITHGGGVETYRLADSAFEASAEVLMGLPDEALFAVLYNIWYLHSKGWAEAAGQARKEILRAYLEGRLRKRTRDGRKEAYVLTPIQPLTD